MWAMEREGRRSQVRDLRDTAEGSQSDSFKCTQKKEKAEADKLRKDETSWGKGLGRVGCDPKRVFKFEGIKG